MLLVLAHAAHWAIQLLYVAPVVGFLVWLGVSQFRLRRSGRPDEDERGDDERGDEDRLGSEAERA